MAFPPEDIRSFLEHSAGDWLALRSLMEAEVASPLGEFLERGEQSLKPDEGWHHSQRGELAVTFLQAASLDEWGGLEITLPDGLKQQLIFQKDGTVLINGRSGVWQFGQNGTLALEIKEETRMVKERIWYGKPNLRLRCTIEQFLDARPGRSSFSSEIRRVRKPDEVVLPPQAD